MNVAHAGGRSERRQVGLGALGPASVRECVIMNPHLALCRVDSVLGRTSGEQRGLRPPTSLGRRCGLLCLCQELSAPHPESPSGDGFTAPCQPQGHSKTCDRLLTPAGAWGFSLKLPCLPRVTEVPILGFHTPLFLTSFPQEQKEGLRSTLGDGKLCPQKSRLAFASSSFDATPFPGADAGEALLGLRARAGGHVA